MKPSKMRKVYAELFLTERSIPKLTGGMEDARQEVIAVLRRLQTELERISTFAAEQGDVNTMDAAQDLLGRVALIKGVINRDFIAYLDSAADLAEAQIVVDDANDRLTKIGAGTARAIKRYEKAVPVLNSIEKLIKFVKEH